MRHHASHTETFDFTPPTTCTAVDSAENGTRYQTRLSSAQGHFATILLTNPSLDQGWLPVLGRGLGWQWQRLETPTGDAQYRYHMHRPNNTFVQSSAVFLDQPTMYGYNSRSCLSGCTDEAAQASRILEIAYDCAVCGDGEFFPGREECDDGNRLDGDGCSAECKVEVPVQVNASVTYSIFSSNPGTVTLMWQHSSLSLLALLPDPDGKHTMHSVLNSEVIVVREHQESFSADGQYMKGLVNYTERSLLPFFGVECNQTTCVLRIREILGGESLTVSLTAQNVAGESSQWMWDGRLETLPFGLLHVVYQDQVPLQSLTWNAPPSSGWGNSLELPIV